MTANPGISVSPQSPVPPFEQVRQQLADLIISGTLTTGSRLPPVRQLAADLGLAAGTIARSYQELENAGMVTTNRRGGTRVAQTPPLTPPARAAKLAGHAQTYVGAARRIGASDTELLTAIRQAIAQ